ncbi:MAG: sulfonate ABC transporter substrate-binding protein [Azospirillaceae bacterium]|nr:sulfonate ABC transporter substrate-binding protein [Azospirillaceae bacterium]
MKPWRPGMVMAALLYGIGLMVIGASGAAAGEGRELRVGFQKYGTLTILKAKGTLDRRLAALGVSVRWVEFPAGPQLLEALNVGSVDIGGTGEAPPVFAQAANADLVYFGYDPASPTAEAVVVAKDSPIHSVAELKGKRIVLNKGSNVHYLLVRALETAGLSLKDVQPVYLPPADGRAAFERGAVDAWVIWDPFLAAAQQALGVRVLIDGSGGVASNYEFYLARRAYAGANPDIIRAILDDLAQVGPAAQADAAGTAQLLAQQTGIDVEALTVAVKRQNSETRPVDDAVIAAQQQIADSFFALGLIPRAISVRDAQWRPSAP